MAIPNRRGPRALSDILGELFTVRGYGRFLARQELEDAWNAAVGEPLCRQTQLGEVRRGVLNVTVSHPALLEELAAFRKPELLAALRTGAPGDDDPRHPVPGRSAGIGRAEPDRRAGAGSRFAAAAATRCRPGRGRRLPPGQEQARARLRARPPVPASIRPDATPETHGRTDPKHRRSCSPPRPLAHPGGRDGPGTGPADGTESQTHAG